MQSWLQKATRKWLDWSRPERRRRQKLSRLERRIDYSFHNSELLETALSHLSYINVNGRKDIESNERLEFLGDAVLDLIVSEYLYNHFVESREGELTRIKTSIVSRTALARQGQQLDLEEYVLYSRESMPDFRRGRETIIANCLEALIGAIYLDGGLKPVRSFVYHHLLGSGKVELGYDTLHEAKNMLLHLSQVSYGGQPVYRIVEVSGPEHARRFTCEVMVSGKVLGRGSGSNKKEAEKRAARQALQHLGELDSDQDDEQE